MHPSDEQKREIAKRIADESYDAADYQRADPVSRGLAVTHEQVSDSYMAGETDSRTEQNGGEQNAPLPRQKN